MRLEFSVPAKPVAKARPRFTFTGRAYTPKATADFERLVAACARCAMLASGQSPAEGCLHASLEFYYEPPKSWRVSDKRQCEQAGRTPKTTKPDTDNLVKAVLDGMNGVVFKDDAQITRVTALKAWSYRHGDTVLVTISDDTED